MATSSGELTVRKMKYKVIQAIPLRKHYGHTSCSNGNQADELG